MYVCTFDSRWEVRIIGGDPRDLHSPTNPLLSPSSRCPGSSPPRYSCRCRFTSLARPILEFRRRDSTGEITPFHRASFSFPRPFLFHFLSRFFSSPSPSARSFLCISRRSRPRSRTAKLNGDDIPEKMSTGRESLVEGRFCFSCLCIGRIVKTYHAFQMLLRCVIYFRQPIF